MLTEKTSKNIKKFYCESCDFECCKKGDYTRHLSTRKHKMLINANISIPESDKIHFCECGKSYKQMPSLSRHKKTCTFINEEKETNNGGNFYFLYIYYFFENQKVKKTGYKSQHQKQKRTRINVQNAFFD